MSDTEEEKPSRRVVNIWVKPKDGLDPAALHKKITETVLPPTMKWEEGVKVEDGKIYSSFTINEEIDFFEEVMDAIEMMYDEVEGQDIIFQSVME